MFACWNETYHLLSKHAECLHIRNIQKCNKEPFTSSWPIELMRLITTHTANETGGSTATTRYIPGSLTVKRHNIKYHKMPSSEISRMKVVKSAAWPRWEILKKQIWGLPSEISSAFWLFFNLLVPAPGGRISEHSISATLRGHCSLGSERVKEWKSDQGLGDVQQDVEAQTTIKDQPPHIHQTKRSGPRVCGRFCGTNKIKF